MNRRRRVSGPSCFSAGNTRDEAIDNAREAIEETAVDDDGHLPLPRPIAEYQAEPEYSGWIWAGVDVDLASL